MSSTTRCMALSAVLVTVAYANSFVNEFTSWDDRFLVVENAHVKDLSWTGLAGLFARPVHGTYLPLRALSYALDFRLWGLNPFGYHLTNVALHAANVWLVLALAGLAFDSLLARLACALAFAVHPVHAEAVTWISGRRDVLSAFFFLSSLALFVRAREAWAAAYFGSLACFLAALLSKGTTVVLPLALILCVWLKAARRETPRWQRSPLAYLPFVLLAAAFVAIHALVGKQAGAIKEYHGGSFAATMATMAQVLLSYVRLIFVPENLCASYYLRPPADVSTGAVLLRWLPLAGLAALALVGLRRSWLPAFSGLWFLVALLPVLNLVPISTLKAERYLYVPSVAFCLLLGGAAGSLRKPTTVVLLGSLVACLAAGLAHRNETWRDSRTLWLDTLRKCPVNPKAASDLGLVYQSEGQVERAIRQYQRALRIDDKLTKVYNNLGTAYNALGKNREALAAFTKAVEADANYAKGHFNLGEQHRVMGNVQEALKHYRRAVECDPELGIARQRLDMMGKSDR